MEQYRFNPLREKNICTYLIDGTSFCGIAHRNPMYQLCKKHRLQVEKEIHDASQVSDKSDSDEVGRSCCKVPRKPKLQLPQGPSQRTSIISIPKGKSELVIIVSFR